MVELYTGTGEFHLMKVDQPTYLRTNHVAVEITDWDEMTYCLKRNGYRRAYVASFEDVTEGSWLEVVVAIAQSCSRAWLICPRRRTGLSLRYWIAMVSRCSCVSTPESRSLR